MRYPVRIAKCVYYKDDIVKNSKDQIEILEQLQYKIKSFFVYKDYSNIYKFYESRQFYEFQKKFNFLCKLDVSKCFNSIYTHSISWAVYGKQFVKDFYLKKLSKKFTNSFGDKFDALLRSSNSNETNGIPIGPEISRIFAEIILQNVDLEIEHKLSSSNLELNRDYIIKRYVDDYFIFYNLKENLTIIKNELILCLKEFNLNLNLQKEEYFYCPFITNISIFKHEFSLGADQYIKTDVIEHNGLKSLKINFNFRATGTGVAVSLPPTYATQEQSNTNIRLQ